MQYYGASAPEFEITNLLDDGILRLFAAGDFAAVETRLRDLLAVAQSAYGAEFALVTCSAVPRDLMNRLCAETPVPVLKIDAPMAAKAVRTGGRIGVAVTFAPTLDPATRLLTEAAEEIGASVELISRVMPEAYQALLGGNLERHDELLLAGIDQLAGQGVDAIVLAQVSMARILEKAEARVPMPVFSSLQTSLAAIRDRLA